MTSLVVLISCRAKNQVRVKIRDVADGLSPQILCFRNLRATRKSRIVSLTYNKFTNWFYCVTFSVRFGYFRDLQCYASDPVHCAEFLIMKGRYKTRTGSTRTGSDRINSDQSGSDQVGSTQIDWDRQKLNKLRNMLNFYLILGLIPLRNGPFTRHFDF